MSVPVVPDNVVDVIALAGAVRDRIVAQIPQPAPSEPKIKGYLSEPVNVPTLDADGHVQRHWVLHPWLGNPDVDPDLAQAGVDLTWTFQLNAVAHTGIDCLQLAQQLHAALHRHALTVPGHDVGPLHVPDGYDPGNPRIDKDVVPHRFWLPLQYRTTVTR